MKELKSSSRVTLKLDEIERTMKAELDKLSQNVASSGGSGGSGGGGGETLNGGLRRGSSIVVDGGGDDEPQDKDVDPVLIGDVVYLSNCDGFGT